MGKAVASINLSSGVEANNNARQVATNYLASDDTGIMVAELSGSSETPSTATGNNVRITSTSVDIRKGQTNLTTVGQSGMQIYADDAYHTQIANLGYGPTKNEQGQTVSAPYYDLGFRKVNTTAGYYSVAEGTDTTASGAYSHAEGVSTVASGHYSHAEGHATTASGQQSHAEGVSTVASGDSSHAEGAGSVASNFASHAEGNTTTASGLDAHAEGNLTIASGNSSHAEGFETKAVGEYSHAEGWGTEANGFRSHAQGLFTKTSETDGVVLGRYNSTTNGYAVVIGGGNAETNTRDILKVDWNGNVTASGSVSQKKASFDGTAAGVSGFWNSAITTRSDAYLERIGNTVYFYLRFTSPSTVTSGQNVCTIPEGYRPTHICHYSTTVAWENNNNSPISVSTNGVVAFINQAFSASKSYILCATWLTENTFP